MRNLKDLVAELSSEGVEHKQLGEVGTFTRGSGLQKKDFVENGVSCVHYGEIYKYYGTSTTSTRSAITPELAGRLKKARTGDLIITTTSENIEDVCSALVWLGDGEVAIGGHSCVYRHTLDPMFAAYYFQSRAFQDQKRKHVSGTKVKDIRMGDLATVVVPVPSLSVQREIAALLESMELLEAELEAELRAELEACRQQYEHYRTTLLTFERDGDTPWLPLAELLAEPLANGRSVRSGSGYPVLRLTALRGSTVDLSEQKPGSWSDAEGRRFRIEPGDVLVVRGNGSKNLIARACMVEEPAEVAFPDTAIRIRPELERLSQRFFYYAWESPQTRAQLVQVAKQTSGVWKVSQDDLLGVSLPVPARDRQDEIVAILDRFDALAADLSSGLLAEIAARRKQYEYYRDLLLTFPEKEPA